MAVMARRGQAPLPGTAVCVECGRPLPSRWTGRYCVRHGGAAAPEDADRFAVAVEVLAGMPTAAFVRVRAGWRRGADPFADQVLAAAVDARLRDPFGEWTPPERTRDKARLGRE